MILNQIKAKNLNCHKIVKISNFVEFIFNAGKNNKNKNKFLHIIIYFMINLIYTQCWERRTN